MDQPFGGPADLALKGAVMKGLRLFLSLTCIAFASSATAQVFCILPCSITPCSQYTWPTDPPPCDAASTLQACVDNAGPDDTVQIATNFVNESISIQNALTLRAAQGFTPVFASGRSITAEPKVYCNSFTIEGLTLDQGDISVIQQSDGSMNAQIVGNTILSPSTNIGATEVGGSGGPVGFDVSGNTISVPYDDSGVLQREIGIGVSSVGPSLTGRIEGNSIAMEGIVGRGAIQITTYADSSQIDVIANRITGEHYENGVFFEQAAGTAQGRVLDNLVIGTAGGNGGTKGAISFESTAGTLDANVVNNTIAAAERGIYVYGATSVSGLVANNIMSGSTQEGIWIDPASAATVPNRNNLLFGAGGQDFYGTTPGPGTLSMDPLFVGPDDYHLQAASPAIDAGDDASVPADLTTDLEDNPRIQGAHVDIGAYETAPEPTAQTLEITALGALLVPKARRKAVRVRI